MMKMQVHFYSTLRQIAGCKALEMEALPGRTVRQVLALLVDRYPALGEMLLDGEGRVYDAAPLFVNGRNPRLLPRGLDSELAAGDVLSLFAPVASGRLNVEALRQVTRDAR